MAWGNRRSDPGDGPHDTGTGTEAAAADPERPDPPGDPEEVARIICLRMLDRRAYSRAELVAALRRRGVPDEPAARVLDRFTELDLINDAVLADGLARAQHRERGLAGRAVALKLRQRGIADDTVRSAVATIDAASERATAEALVTRKLRTMGGLDPMVQARRLVGLLARKGYPPALAHEVVRRCVNEQRSAEAGSELPETGTPFDE